MMRVIDVFNIKGRGPVVSVICDTDRLPKPGDTLVRASDGKSWTIRGVERHAINPRSWVGSPIGLLVRADPPAKDDEVRVLCPTSARTDK